MKILRRGNYLAYWFNDAANEWDIHRDIMLALLPDRMENASDEEKTFLSWDIQDFKALKKTGWQSQIRDEFNAYFGLFHIDIETKTLKPVGYASITPQDNTSFSTNEYISQKYRNRQLEDLLLEAELIFAARYSYTSSMTLNIKEDDGEWQEAASRKGFKLEGVTKSHSAPGKRIFEYRHDLKGYVVDPPDYSA